MPEVITKDKVIDQSYRLLQLLGRGGMGEVWMAQHLRLPRRVALKILLASASERHELLARFKREAQITSQLGHPNIVEVIDTNTLPDGRPYYVMELLEGENLRHRLRDGKVAQQKSLEILRHVASGLHAAHRAGVVHRDLKPENIFLARVTTDFGIESEVAKIVDFGISKLQQPQDFVTRDDRVLGTAPYMAPEQAQGKNELVGARTDQFALATITYEMLTGERLFCGDTMVETTFKVVYERPAGLDRLPDLLPEAMAAAIDRALQKDPDDRFADVVDFYAALSGEEVPTGDREREIAPLAGPFPSGIDAGAAAMLEVLGANKEEAATQAERPAALEKQSGSGVRSDRHEQDQESATSSATVAGRHVAPEQIVTSPGPARGHRNLGLALLAIVLVVGGAVASAMLMGERRATSAAADAQPARVDARPAPPDAQPGRPDIGRDTASRETLARDARTLGDISRRRRHVKPPAPAAGPPPPKPKPSPAAAALLRQAEQALRVRDFDRALRKATRALEHGRLPQVFSAMARAYCGLRNLGMVRATMRNVSSRERRRIKRFCRKVGMPL